MTPSMTPMKRLIAIVVAVFACPSLVSAGAIRVFLADQGDNAGYNNRIIEIDPFRTRTPPTPEDGNAIVLRTIPSPAARFLDELSFDGDRRLWCIVKNDGEQTLDGATLIDPESGAILRQIYPFILGHVYGSFLEGVAWDGDGLWVSGVRSTTAGDPNGNVLTRVDPFTGQRTVPFTVGTLAPVQMCRIPGNIAQGLLFEPGGAHGYLWHSDIGLNRLYKLDLARLYDLDPGNDNNLATAQFAVPFRPKGMAWMGSTIWVTSPWNQNDNDPGKNGVWEFNPQTGGTRQLFRTPNWNLDGIAIAQFPTYPKDLDGDRDVDLDDFRLFHLCFNGPNSAPSALCTVDADFDTDGDVDLVDFGRFVSCFNGVNRPPACDPE